MDLPGADGLHCVFKRIVGHRARWQKQGAWTGIGRKIRGCRSAANDPDSQPRRGARRGGEASAVEQRRWLGRLARVRRGHDQCLRRHRVSQHAGNAMNRPSQQQVAHIPVAIVGDCQPTRHGDHCAGQSRSRARSLRDLRVEIIPGSSTYSIVNLHSNDDISARRDSDGPIVGSLRTALNASGGATHGCEIGGVHVSLQPSVESVQLVRKLRVAGDRMAVIPPASNIVSRAIRMCCPIGSHKVFNLLLGVEDGVHVTVCQGCSQERLRREKLNIVCPKFIPPPGQEILRYGVPQHQAHGGRRVSSHLKQARKVYGAVRVGLRKHDAARAVGGSPHPCKAVVPPLGEAGSDIRDCIARCQRSGVVQVLEKKRSRMAQRPHGMSALPPCKPSQ
mmetsp:Transcript_118448/g.271720  ORF Transcript_118448/g.271720 Transcript_118448/m.271720 type:complete len:391 (-) Transcript_118448:563-1735(-)